MVLDGVGEHLTNAGLSEYVALALVAFVDFEQQHRQVGGRGPQASGSLFGMIMPASRHEGAVDPMSARGVRDSMLTGLNSPSNTTAGSMPCSTFSLRDWASLAV